LYQRNKALPLEVNVGEMFKPRCLVHTSS
jgi:hypothetical protein